MKTALEWLMTLGQVNVCEGHGDYRDYHVIGKEGIEKIQQDALVHAVTLLAENAPRPQVAFDQLCREVARITPEPK